MEGIRRRFQLARPMHVSSRDSPQSLEFWEGESPRGVSPRGARRTVRDTLASYGSHQGAPAHRSPGCKQVRGAAGDRRDPSPCTSGMITQFLVFLSGPVDQLLIQLADHRVKPCTVIPAVVLEPAPENRIVEAGKIFQRLMTALPQAPVADDCPHRLGSISRDRGTEIGEDFSVAIDRLPRTEFVPKKIELLIGVHSLPQIILAIDDPRLLRMEFQPTVQQPLRNCLPNRLGLPFRSTVHDDIIGVPLEWNTWIVRRHPSVECIMQKQISQQRTGHAPYTKGNLGRQSGLAVNNRRARGPAGRGCYGES